MATIDFGLGEREFRCTYLTLSIYEQEFHSDPYEKVSGDLIQDVLGKHRITDESLGFEFDDKGEIVAIISDFTNEDWNVEKRALWAMLKTAAEIAKLHGEEHDDPGPFRQWDKTLIECEPNLHEVGLAVTNELQRGLF